MYMVQLRSSKVNAVPSCLSFNRLFKVSFCGPIFSSFFSFVLWVGDLTL